MGPAPVDQERGRVGSITDNQQQESHKILALCCKPCYNEAKEKLLQAAKEERER
jgi:hypothetical protein